MATTTKQDLINSVTDYIAISYPINQADKVFIKQQINNVNISSFTDQHKMIPALSKIIIERLKKKTILNQKSQSDAIGYN